MNVQNEKKHKNTNTTSKKRKYEIRKFKLNSRDKEFRMKFVENQYTRDFDIEFFVLIQKKHYHEFDKLIKKTRQ